MPKDIKTRFSIEGEQEYRKSMRDAANAVKVLNSEQKLAAAQFKNTGNAEKFAADQARILQEKIRQQEQAVRAAEKALKQLSDDGVNKNSKRWQEWQTRLNTAQTALVNMQTEMNSLGSTMDNASAQASGLGDSLDGISKKLSLQNITSGLKSIDSLLSSAAKSALEIGKNLVSSVTEGAAWADDLLTNSLVYGIDQDTLQKWERAATHFDTSVEAMVKSRQKLVQNMKYGSDEVMEAFGDLGVNIYDSVLAGGKTDTVQRTLRNTEDVLWEVGEALAQLDRDDPNTEGLAMKLLGRNWAELLPLFTEGRKAYNEFMEKQSTVDAETVQNMADANEAMDALRYEWSVTLHQLEGSMAPALEQVSGILQGVLKEFNDYLATDEGNEKMKELSDAVVSLFDSLKDIKPDDVIDTAKSILEGVVNSLTWIGENWENVVHGIEAIGIAWGAIKITEGVTALMNLASGISGLTAGAAGRAAGASWGTAFGAAVLKAVPWLAGALVLTRGVWDQNYNASGQIVDENGNYEEDVKDVLYSGMESDWKYQDKIRELYALYGADQMQAILENAQLAGMINDWIVGGKGSANEFGSTHLFGYEQGNYKVSDDVIGDFLIEHGYNGIHDKSAEKAAELEREASEKRAEKLARMEARLDPVTKAMEQEQAAREEVAEALEQETKKERINSESTPEILGMPVDFRLMGAALGGFLGWGFASNLNQKLASDQQKAQIEAEAVISDPAENREEITESVGVVDLPARLVVIGHVGPDGYLHGGGGSSKDLIFESTQPNYNANGIWSVPFDGYHAILHKGERVMPAREVGSSRNYSSNLYVESMYMNNGTDAEGLAAAMAAAQQRTSAGYGS
jgi:hypothetical protein